MKLSLSEETQAGIRRIATTCITHWSRKVDVAHPEKLVLRAQFTEGARREGVSQALFEFMYNVLTSMQCWNQAEVLAPWKYHVIYELSADSVETSAGLPRSLPGMRASITCNEKGDSASLDVAYDDPHDAVRIPLGTHGAVHVRTLRSLASRVYLKKNTVPIKAVVEARKTFTFREFVDWNYDFVLRYREPYHKTDDLVSDCDSKSLYYCDPPLCVVNISCEGAKSMTDDKYFADSLLCKLSDLLPPAWQV
jgi:hypothetical protein